MRFYHRDWEEEDMMTKQIARTICQTFVDMKEFLIRSHFGNLH